MANLTTGDDCERATVTRLGSRLEKNTGKRSARLMRGKGGGERGEESKGDYSPGMLLRFTGDDDLTTRARELAPFQLPEGDPLMEEKERQTTAGASYFML